MLFCIDDISFCRYTWLSDLSEVVGWKLCGPVGLTKDTDGRRGPVLFSAVKNSAVSFICVFLSAVPLAYAAKYRNGLWLYSKAESAWPALAFPYPSWKYTHETLTLFSKSPMVVLVMGGTSWAVAREGSMGGMAGLNVPTTYKSGVILGEFLLVKIPSGPRMATRLLGGAIDDCHLGVQEQANQKWFNREHPKAEWKKLSKRV